MSVQVISPFEDFLRRRDEEAWSAALEELLPSVHEVDRDATRIWFAFYPLALLRALEAADDPRALEQKLLLQGRFYLKDQVDSSHRFLYGHRFWPHVKRAVVAHAARSPETFDAPLAAQIRETAGAAASDAKTEAALTLGITAVAFMTVAQAGLEAFAATPGAVLIDERHARRTPREVLSARAKDDSQGLLGFLRTTDKQWTVTFDENDPEARFKMFYMQEVASAAPSHPRKDWTEVDPRCTVGEGPIPVQCRSASCGTCWVGVLGGAEKLSEVSERERKVVRQLGYADTNDPHPLIRLSCQARGTGAVSVVIPPWNGVFGKHLRRLKSGEAETGVAAEANA